MSDPSLAVIGATGAVGREVLRILEERRFPLSSLRLVATARSAGRRIPFRGEEIVVEEIGDAVFANVDLALFDTPDEAALEWVPSAVERGVVVVDNSAAMRLRDDVPLVIPEINADAARTHAGIVANPNCTAVTLLMPLAPLHRAFGSERVVVSSYQSVSGAGQAGVTDLYEQLEKLLPERGPVAAGAVGDIAPPGTAFAHPIAFNTIPHVGSFGESGFTSEEQRMRDETRKILEAPAIEVFATCVRVPTVVGHGVAAWVRFSKPVSAADATAVIRAADGVVLEDDLEARRYPTTLLSAGADKGYVGRLRSDPADPRAIGFYATCDNLRKGAALNAVQIAELLVREGLV